MFSNAKKSDLENTIPENAQDNTIYYLHCHLKTTVKLHITVFSEVTEYKTVIVLDALCNSNLFRALCKRNIH